VFGRGVGLRGAGEVARLGSATSAAGDGNGDLRSSGRDQEISDAGVYSGACWCSAGVDWSAGGGEEEFAGASFLMGVGSVTMGKLASFGGGVWVIAARGCGVEVAERTAAAAAARR
jgi:hypothetical protein